MVVFHAKQEILWYRWYHDHLIVDEIRLNRLRWLDHLIQSVGVIQLDKFIRALSIVKKGNVADLPMDDAMA